MGFFSSILGTLKEFMALTAMLYRIPFLGFESLHLREGVISPNALLLSLLLSLDQSSISVPFSSL